MIKRFLILMIIILSVGCSADKEYKNEYFNLIPINNLEYFNKLKLLKIEKSYLDTIFLGFILNDSKENVNKRLNLLIENGQLKDYVKEDSVYFKYYSSVYNTKVEGNGKFYGYSFQFYYNDTDKVKAVLNCNFFRNDSLKQLEISILNNNVSFEDLIIFISKKYGKPILITKRVDHRGENYSISLWIKNGVEIKLENNMNSYSVTDCNNILYTDLKWRYETENEIIMEKLNQIKSNNTKDSIQKEISKSF